MTYTFKNYLTIEIDVNGKGEELKRAYYNITQNNKDPEQRRETNLEELLEEIGHDVESAIENEEELGEWEEGFTDLDVPNQNNFMKVCYEIKQTDEYKHEVKIMKVENFNE